MYCQRVLASLWLTCLLTYWADVGESAVVTCPWEEKGLISWSDASAWGSDGVPGENAKAVIATGKRVLLDVQPAALGTLNIEEGAALVWGDVDGLVLDTHHILIRGEFHIGSDNNKCRFSKKATIRLRGETGDKYYVAEELFGRKFIGVVSGATLELHGKKKTSWTKLAQTIHPAAHIENALIYSHAKSPLKEDNQKGLHLIVWTEQGKVLDYNVFRDYTNFNTFFEKIPKRSIVAMFAYGDDGLGKRKKGKLNINLLDPVIKKLGGSVITQVNQGDSYAFIGMMGDVSTVKEYTKSDGQKYPAPKGYLHLYDPTTQLVFQVATSGDEEDYFRVLHEDAAYPIITMVDEVEGWNVGDEVFVASTDFEWRQAETKRLVACDVCTPRQIKLDGSFQYLHYGNFTNHVDERAEVGLLTRHILIEGIMGDKCSSDGENAKQVCDHFKKDIVGGHVLVSKGHKAVHIEGVELYHVGQQTALGHYPLHFHMCGDVEGMYIKDNTVHESYSRCITIHGTNQLEVSGNVCYEHYGHGLFTEDGVEQLNIIKNNLVVGTMYGTLLLSDMSKAWCKVNEKNFVENCGDLSSFWITHPNNNVTGNVAGGGEGNGFMYVFADIPLGPARAWYKSEGLQHHPKDQPILEFSHNVAHSNKASGVFMDSKISTGTGMENKGMIKENGIIQTESEYDPHVDGEPVWCNMSHGTYYKNGHGNMWIKGGNVRVTYTTMADSPEGFSGGTTLFDTGTEVYRSIFIGQTENQGASGKANIPPHVSPTGRSESKYFDHSVPGLPTDSVTGVGLYQGPVFLKSNFFDNYLTRSWCLEDMDLEDCEARHVMTQYAGAISFKRSNNYPTMTSSYVENNTFGFCDNENGLKHQVFQGRAPQVPDFVWRDGNVAVIFRDKDGLLTGTVDANVLPDIPLYKGDECLERPDWGNMMVCPYRYVKFELLGTSGNLAGTIDEDYPLMIRRDDPNYDTIFAIKGEIRNEYLLRTHQSYVIDFNTTHKKGGFPEGLKLFGYGVESQDVVRIGLCQPVGLKEADFKIYMDYPAYIKVTPNWVHNLKDLDSDTVGDAFFYDSVNGILFFKLISKDQDTNDTQQCPNGHCWKVKITRSKGSTKLRSCAGITVPPFKNNLPTPKKPKTPKCQGIGSPEGLGPIQWDQVDFVVKEKYMILSLKNASPPKGKKVYKGCWWEKKSKKVSQGALMKGELVELPNSMSVDLCVDRCFYRGYNVSALSRGRRCTCGFQYNNAAALKGDSNDCQMPCLGNKTQKCGDNKHMAIYSITPP